MNFEDVTTFDELKKHIDELDEIPGSLVFPQEQAISIWGKEMIERMQNELQDNVVRIRQFRYYPDPEDPRLNLDRHAPRRHATDDEGKIYTAHRICIDVDGEILG